MKLEVGMYVRTKCGIEQIYRIDNNKTKWKYVYKLKEQDGDGCINIGILSSEDILKASHNIIDLIEVGDYVNGLYIDQTPENPDYKLIWHLSTYGEDDEAFGEEDIKTIVTKEQFEAMAYKVV
jgi:hypothetical protein